MKNRILIPLFGLAILSVIISVFVGHRKETAAAKGAIVGYDDLGKKIVLPKVPERVVVLNRLTLLHNRKLHVQGKPEDVLTPANLRAAYEVEVTVDYNPSIESLQVVVMSGKRGDKTPG